MYSPHSLRMIIKTATMLINLWSPEAEELLLGTAAKESHLGRWTVQVGGPAVGVCQVEPRTERDNWEKYLTYRGDLKKLVMDATGLDGPDPFRLMADPIYNVIMARIWYRRRPGALPQAYDIKGQAEYWKEHYNTMQGRGTTGEYIECYNKYVL